VKHLNKNKTVLHDKPIYFEKVADALSIEVAHSIQRRYDEKVYSFANNINTVDGGTHLSDFVPRSRVRSMLTRSRPVWRRTSKVLCPEMMCGKAWSQ
jgi:DNA gyrase subunit B